MDYKSTKQKVFILLLIMMTVWCNAKATWITSKNYNIQIKYTTVHGTPKTTSIQASINGHLLSVVFLENLGQVDIEVSEVEGGEVETSCIQTPNGMNIYISDSGSYIVTFTLENGDEYYGEFEVTD